MKNNPIPVVFTFDDNYTIPAAVAIKSLIHKGLTDTQYEIYCLFENLSDYNRKKLDNIAEINWIKIDKGLFSNVPATSEYPVDVYYRLAIHEILTKYEKIIYSDVDVLFQDDLTELYTTDVEDAYWAGVPLEKNETPSKKSRLSQVGNKNDQSYMSGHTKFEENKNDLIFASGLMLINAKKMREDNMTENFLRIIEKYAGKLKMFDLEVLNLGCQNDTIKKLPFDYCVLEDLLVTKDFKTTNVYPFLSRVFSDTEINNAVSDPKILHYTGSNEVRVWNRPTNLQPDHYRSFFNMVQPLLYGSQGVGMN